MRRTLHATGELAELRDLEQFPVRVTEVLREMIPCKHCAYNAIYPDSGGAVVVANPRETVFEEVPRRSRNSVTKPHDRPRARRRPHRPAPV
jgi:hypothetical protein